MRMRTFFHPLITPSLLGGVIIFADQLCKWFARTSLATPYYFGSHYFGLEYFENAGIAFSLPLPNSIVIGLTPLILLLFVIWFGYMEKTVYACFGASLFIAGAVSNYVDRVLFGYTIDYIRILTGVINLADIAVVIGILLLMKKSRPLPV